MKKSIFFLVIILLLILPASILFKFWSAPGLAKVAMAAQSGCDIPQRYKQSLKYRIEHVYSTIYRQYIFRFGIDEVLEDGSLSIAFLPITYNMHNNTCKESSIILFERLLELGCNINTKGYFGNLKSNKKFTILHDAILTGNEELVSYLLDKGADPMITVQMPGYEIDNLNSIELADILKAKKKSASRSNILAMLKNK